MSNTEYDFDELYVIDSSGAKDEQNQLFTLYNKIKENAENMPVKELVSRKVMETTGLLELTAFVSAHSSATNFYRKANNSEEINGIIWASLISRRANEIDIETELPIYSAENIDEEFLDTLKQVSTKPEEFVNLPKLLSLKGVILVFEPTIKSSLVDGVAGKTISGRPYIGMSLRYNRIDNLWFTLFHEIGHIIHHYDLIDSPILDSDDILVESEIEIEADLFAKQALIPRYVWNSSPLKFSDKFDQDRREESIYKIAEQLGIHPAIVAGRFRREFGKYTLHSDIVHEINTREWIWGMK